MTDELKRLEQENKQLKEKLLESQKELKSRLREMLNLKDLLIKRQDDLIDFGDQIIHSKQQLEQYKTVTDEIKDLPGRIMADCICDGDCLHQRLTISIKQSLSKLGDGA